MGFPGGAGGKETACNAGDKEFDPWDGTIPPGREWQPTPVPLPGEPPWAEEAGGLQSVGHRVRHA